MRRQRAGGGRLRHFNNRPIRQAARFQRLARCAAGGQGGGQHDRASIGHLFKRQRRLPRPGMILRHDRMQTQRRQPQAADAVDVGRCADDDAQVDAVVHRHFDDLQRGAGADGHRHRRMRPAHAGHGGGQQAGRRDRDGADIQPRQRALPDVDGQPVHGLDAGQRVEHFGYQRAALAGEVQAAVLAAEQRKAQPCLHVAQQGAGGGLRHVDRRGRGGDGVVPVHGAQQQEFSPVEHMNFI
ncbi:hypothetical protein D3C72_1395110 [compost metagenome]